MGFLQSLFDTQDPSQERNTKPTIDLPEDEYTVATPAAVRHAQLIAFQTVIDTDRDTPHIDGPGADLLRNSLNEAWKDVMSDEETWEESIERTRADAEAIVTRWLDLIDGDLGVVFVPVGACHRLKRVLHTCEVRADNDEDPFTLPDEYVDAVALLKHLRKIEDEKDSVIVHQDQVPSTSTEGN